MTNENTGIKHLLLQLGYHETSIPEILKELDILFKEIDFDGLREAARSQYEKKDINGFINSLKDLMKRLEGKGYYRPDFPTRLIKYLVNGLVISKQDIFALLDKADIPQKEKESEKEFLASCAAITQLGYIIMSGIASGLKAASSGPHVFIVLDNFSSGSMIFVDFSIDAIIEIDNKKYEHDGNSYHLRDTSPPSDNETSMLLKKYYPFFNVLSDIGLSHNIHNNLGMAYDKISKYEEAIEEFGAALELSPDYPEVHNNLAVTLDKMGYHYEAMSELKVALKLNPSYAEAHSNMGNVHAKLGNFLEAVREIQEALKINPDYATAHNNLGNIHAMQDKREEAIKEFNEALRLNPDCAIAFINLGNLYSETGKHENALTQFQEALRLEPALPEASAGIGFAYYNLGSYDRSAKAWIRAVSLAPALLDCVPEKLILKVRQGISRL